MYRKQVRRRRAVLALLVVGSFALLSVTYGQNSSNSLQRGVSTIFSPLQTIADRALKPARDLVDWFDKTFQARGENSRLRAELAKARTQAVAGQEAVQENAQLRKLVGLDRRSPIASGEYRPVTGRVIARSPTLWHSVVTIDIGSGDGVTLDDPVVSGDGLVGHVSSVEPGSSQVTLLSDHASAVSGKVLPAGVQGIVEPDVGNPEELILNYIDPSHHLHQGQTIVTAGWRSQGLASLFPPGLPIGEVSQASIVEQEASQQVHLRPFADLANLELIQVLTRGSHG